MKVRSIETRHCDAGWRNYHYAKVTTEDGVVGWSEYDEHQGAIGVTAVVEQLAPMLRRVHGLYREQGEEIERGLKGLWQQKSASEETS